MVFIYHMQHVCERKGSSVKLKKKGGNVSSVSPVDGNIENIEVIEIEI